MSEQWPDFKKEMEKILVPTEKLDLIIANTVDQNQRKKSKKKIAIYSLTAAILGLGVLIGSANVSPVMAKFASGIPIIGTFFNESADEGLRIAGQKGLTQIVDQTSKDNGITLTINEIFYDGTRLTFGYTQESIFAIGDLERPTIEVNGKDINFSAGYSGEHVTPQKYKGVIDIQPTEELPEEFDIKMRIDAVGLIPGKWAFQFPVKQSNEVKIARSQETKIFEEAEVRIDSLKLGPAGTDLAVKISKKENNFKLDPYSLDFDIIDEKGNVLDKISGSGSGETENGKEKASLSYLYSPLKDGTKKLRVIPYTIPLSDYRYEDVSMNLVGQKIPFVIDQGDFGKVLITEIKYQEDKIVLYFDMQTDAIVDNKASRNPIWLEDASGKNLSLENKPFAERIKGNSFKQEFALGAKKGIQIKTIKYPKPIYYEEFVVEIP